GWDHPLAIDPETFDRQCAWLAHHRKILDLSQAVGLLNSRGCLPRHTCALTFDDGFAALHDHALPVLTRYGLTATVFVVAETLSAGGRAVDWVDNAPAYPLKTLTLQQVLEMQEAGVRFESHSYSHHDLTGLDDRECEEDLRASRELLEALLGRPVPFLAYPRGRHDERVQRIAERAGYTHAFALPETAEPFGPYSVPRVGVYPANSMRILKAKSSRWYLPVRTSRAYPLLGKMVRGGRKRVLLA
ncbi:MAG: polysaccharide deacetylase family protein, partial [Actinomycetota bacterium]